MKDNLLAEKNKILNNYYDKIDKMIFNSQKIVKKNINYEMVQLYYNIGQSINELIDKFHFEASQNEIIKSF